jgi:hypothetical protein
MELFHFDRARALASITDPDGALWPVNAYSDADELNALADDALTAQIVTREDAGAHFAIYPMSLSEPDPIVSVNPGTGPALLGYSIKLRQHEGEDPVSFTLRLLGDMVAEANRLIRAHCPDDAQLDRPREIEAEAEATSRRYALVVVLDAQSPEQAWEALHGLLSGLEGDGEPDCVYVGAPWQGIPAAAEDLSTERLVLGMSVPDGEGGFVAASTALRPCFD